MTVNFGISRSARATRSGGQDARARTDRLVTAFNSNQPPGFVQPDKNPPPRHPLLLSLHPLSTFVSVNERADLTRPALPRLPSSLARGGARLSSRLSARLEMRGAPVC